MRRLIAVADLWVGSVLVLGVALLAFAGPWLWGQDPLRNTLGAGLQPPGSVAAGMPHPLGTDQLGRDLLARIIAGTRLSLSLVLAAGALSMLAGTAIGLISGYARGWFDTVVMRLVDIQLSIPFILLILLIVSIIGPSVGNLLLVLVVTGWAIFARVARARTLEIREMEYVEAARATGLPVWRILFIHILPNIMTPQVVLLTLDLPRLIVLEASVGFLGLGVQPPTPTLGNLIGEGRSLMLVADWLVLWPGLVIAALVIGFNFIGDGLVHRNNLRL